MTVLHRFWAWARWEFDRDLRVTPVIRFITVERFVKGGVLLLAGVSLLVFGAHANIHTWSQNLQEQLNLNPGRGFWEMVYARLIDRLTTVRTSTEVGLAIGAILYGGLEIVEGVALVRRKRWAEYLVLVATVVFIPYELNEVIRRVTPLKAAALLLNLAIVAYLVWRKRLFLERPGDDAERERMAASASQQWP